MNKVVGLLLLIGVVVAVITNRDKIAAWRSGKVEQEEPVPSAEPSPEVAPPSPRATPHPAKESQAEATKRYPGLSNPNTPLNKKFVALYTEAMHSDPALLTQPDWPMTLAEKAIVAMGGAPLPRNTPTPITPKPLPGGPLDQRGSSSKK